MKRIIKIIICLFLITTLFSCSDNKNKKQKFDISILSDTSNVTGTIISNKSKNSKNNKLSLIPSSDMKQILDKGKIIIGMLSKDLPPFFMTDKKTNKFYGVDVRIGKDIAERIGVKPEFDRSSETVDELMQKLINGEIDIILSKFSRTFDRVKYISFSTPYAELKQAMIFNKIIAMKLKVEDNPYQFLKRVPAKIGVLSGTAYTEFARSFWPKAIIVKYPNYKQLIQAFQNKEIIGVLYDNNEIMRIIRKTPEVALIGSIYVLTNKRDTLAAAVNRNNKQLLEWLNLYLEMLNYNYTVDKLMEQYPEIYDIQP